MHLLGIYLWSFYSSSRNNLNFFIFLLLSSTDRNYTARYAATEALEFVRNPVAPESLPREAAMTAVGTDCSPRR